MTKAHIVFLVLAIFLLLPLPMSLEFASSVVPGWHTTIFPYHSLIQIIFCIWLCLLSAAYWMLKKRQISVNKTVFSSHFLLTIPALVFIKFPFLTLNFEELGTKGMQDRFNLTSNLVLTFYSLFFVGQLVFGVYFVMSIRNKLH